MGITRSFEQKFLFQAGRCLSNLFAVSGVATVLIGIILFFNSSTTTVKSLDEYTKRLNQEIDSKGKELGKEMAQLSYTSQTNPAASIAFNEVQNDFAREVTARDEKVPRYESYVDRVNENKRQYRSIAPLVFGYGLAVITSAAATSAIFSIERNTRKY